MAEQKPGSSVGLRHGAGGCLGESLDSLEGSIESIEDPIKIDAHLKSQCPAGAVIGRDGWSAGILKIIRMILRFEHIENVRSKRLRGFHDVRIGRISLTGNFEHACRTVNRDAIFDECINEF